jgi:hypothetical protein
MIAMRNLYFFVFFSLLHVQSSYAKLDSLVLPHQSGTLSIGLRNTVSLFDKDGAGLGTGGQMRIRFSERVNTDWFADYISINVNNQVRSEYYHIGWSVLFYPFTSASLTNNWQPYILGGHCFDYNVKTVIQHPEVHNYRWGSAVQMGAGSHYHLTDKFDISLTCQYMLHLTKELELSGSAPTIQIVKPENEALQGHLLITLGINFKLFHLWKN